jgi:hypothetical protein
MRSKYLLIGKASMKTQSALQRTLQGFFITGISIFTLAPAHAADAPKVTPTTTSVPNRTFRFFISKIVMSTINWEVHDEL